MAESEQPFSIAVSQDAAELSLPSMMDAAAAAAGSSSAFELLKSTEGKGDSGLESDQDVIVIAEEEQDDEEETDEVTTDNKTGQTAKAAPAGEDISAEQLEAVLDEALRQAAVEQHLPGKVN